WVMTETLRGPFQKSSQDDGLFVVPVGADIPFLSVSPASDDAGGQWSVRLIDMSRSGSDQIIPGNLRQISFLGIRGPWRELVFGLPARFSNDQAVELAVTYRLRMHTGLSDALGYLVLIGIVLELGLVFARTGGLASSTAPIGVQSLKQAVQRNWLVLRDTL